MPTRDPSGKPYSLGGRLVEGAGRVFRPDAVAVKRVASLVALGAVTVLVPALSAQAGGSQFAHPLFKDRDTVDREASDRFGRDYACAVVSPRTAGRPRLLLVYVTGRAAVIAARRLRNELDHPRRTRIRRIPKQFRLEEMERIRDEAFRTQPGDGSVQGIGIGEGRLYYRRCPRVELVILPSGQASAEAEAWAENIQRRYGLLRVVVHRGKSTPRDGG